MSLTLVSLKQMLASYVSTNYLKINPMCDWGNLLLISVTQIDNNIRFSDDVQWNHVSACIYNGGGVRTSIDERTRNGASLISMEV